MKPVTLVSREIPYLPHGRAEMASPPPPDACDDETARRNADRLVRQLMQEPTAPGQAPDWRKGPA